MKSIVTLLLANCFAILVSAQLAPGFTRGTIEYNGVKYPCYEKSFDASKESVEASMEAKMKALGFKGSSRKGYTVYRNISINEINNGDKIDAFVKVESEGKKQPNKAKLFLIVTRPGEITDEKMNKDAAKAAGTGVALVAVTSTFHDDLQDDVAIRHHQSELQVMQDELRQQERKLADLQEERNTLQKRLEKAQKDLEDNAKAIESKTKDLEKQKKLVEAKAAASPGAGGLKKN